MSELERLVVLVAMLALGGRDALGLEADHEGTNEELEQEAAALIEVIRARAESSRYYHKSRRGVDALERVNARLEKRELDYPAAREAAKTAYNLGEI